MRFSLFSDNGDLMLIIVGGEIEMVKVTLKDGVNWVGVVDWNLRDFHGYITRRGSTYNAYLISR